MMTPKQVTAVRRQLAEYVEEFARGVGAQRAAALVR